MITDILAKAEEIARRAHEGQREESTGDPYIRHIERVVDMVQGEYAKAVAWLHDVLEDTNVTLIDLRCAGISDSVLNAVAALTHKDGRSYAEYIEHLKRWNDPLALAVKIADLRDHLRPNCPERLRPRYEKAWHVLTNEMLPARPGSPAQEEG